MDTPTTKFDDGDGMISGRDSYTTRLSKEEIESLLDTYCSESRVCKIAENPRLLWDHLHDLYTHSYVGINLKTAYQLIDQYCEVYGLIGYVGVRFELANRICVMWEDHRKSGDLIELQDFPVVEVESIFEYHSSNLVPIVLRICREFQPNAIREIIRPALENLECPRIQ